MTVERIGVARRYSDLVIHGRRARFSGGRAYFSGYVPENTPGAPIEAQTRDVLDQIAESLAEIGTDRTALLQATVWLADIGDVPAMNGVWEGWLAPGAAPARATVQARLANPDYRIEVQVVAALV